jgi:Spy/CpxP family protein refolding chaperone
VARRIFWSEAADRRPHGARRPRAMRKMNLAVLGTAALTLVLGSVAASAQPPGPDGPGGMGPRMGRAEGMARFLGLSEAQKEQAQKLMEGRRAEHQALREQVEKNRELMEKALEGANPDPVAVGELAIEGHRLRDQGRALREAQDRAVRAILTPEQQARFDAMKALRDEGGPMGRPGTRHGDGPR